MLMQTQSFPWQFQIMGSKEVDAAQGEKLCANALSDIKVTNYIMVLYSLALYTDSNNTYLVVTLAVVVEN